MTEKRNRKVINMTKNETTTTNMNLFHRFYKKIATLFLLICICGFLLTSAVEAQSIARAGLLKGMEIRPDVEVEIPIDIENVTDLYGIEIELEFDPEFWEFRDADPRREGIQPAIGTFLDPGMTLFSIIDMEEGRIHLVMSQVNPSVGKSGKGNILVLYATALKTGTTSFEVKKVELSTRDGIGIDVEGVDGEVTIASEAPLVTATSIPVTDPTQIIIIPTYVPPTATPVPTSTPRPTATAAIAAETQAAGTPQTTEDQAANQTDTASAEEAPQAGAETSQPASADDPAGNGEGIGLSKEGEDDGNSGIWIGVSILAVVLAAVGFFLYNKNKSSSTRED